MPPSENAQQPDLLVAALSGRLHHFIVQSLDGVTGAVVTHGEAGQLDIGIRPRLLDDLCHAALAQAGQVVAATWQHHDQALGMTLRRHECGWNGLLGIAHRVAR